MLLVLNLDPHAGVRLFAKEGYLRADHEIPWQETAGVAVSGSQAWILLNEPLGYAGYALDAYL